MVCSVLCGRLIRTEIAIELAHEGCYVSSPNRLDRLQQLSFIRRSVDENALRQMARDAVYTNELRLYSRNAQTDTR